MKQILISLAYLSVLLVFAGSAFAGETAVVYKPGSLPCTTGDQYYGEPYYTCIDPAIDSNDEYQCGPIQKAVDNASDVIVCQGTYYENVWMWRIYTSLRAWSGNPAHTVIQAADPNKSVIYAGPNDIDGHEIYPYEISGFTIKGATGGGITVEEACDDYSPDNLCVDDRCNPQPCAGIRIWCARWGEIANNIITGNNYGIIIKDTYPNWYFSFDVKYNNIYGNTGAGVKLHYGHTSNLFWNHIYNNKYGVELIDSWNNGVAENRIERNEVAVRQEAIKYPLATALENNWINQNSFVDNASNLDDEALCQPEHSYYNNYWSDYTGIDTDGDGVGNTNSPHPVDCADYFPSMAPYPGTGDSDNDGMPDFYEGGLYGRLDPNDPADAFGDLDGDGRTNLQEYQQLTIPIIYDNTCTNRPVKVYKDSWLLGYRDFYYYSLQTAYDYAPDGQIIKAQATTITENLFIDEDKSVTIQGGYDCDFITNPVTTVLKGSLFVDGGSLAISGGAFAVE